MPCYESNLCVALNFDIWMHTHRHFYDTLFSLAPNLKKTFSKDRELLSLKFYEMVATLVTFSGDPAL